jgi:hypothetical protein
LEGGAASVGVAGIALTDVNRAGDPFTYGMLAHDFEVVRLHAGYGLQNRGNTVLLGMDRTWKISNNDFNLNADLVQTGDQSGWLAALGAKYSLGKHIVLETWANLPDEGKASFIAKVNYVFTF